MSSDDEVTDDNSARAESFVSFALDESTEDNRAFVSFTMDEATEENRARRDSAFSFAMDESTDDNGVRGDSFISFAVDGDDIVEYTDAQGKGRESSQGSQGSEESHDEGEDRLGPMEGEVQKPRVLPRQAEIAKKNTKKRLSAVTDIETGKHGGARAHSAQVSVFRALMFGDSALIQRHCSLYIDPFLFVDYPGNCCQQSEKSELPSFQKVRRFHC
jgi:hypothetical protein